MHAALKQLNTQLSNAKKALADTNNQINSLKETIKEKQREIAEVEAQIKKLTVNITVSEHSILRYLERVEKLDIEVVKAKILPPHVREQIVTLGNGIYPVDGFKIRVRDNVVATITD